MARKDEFRKLLPLLGTVAPTLRRGRHAGGGRLVHHVVLKLAGVGLGVEGLADAANSHQFGVEGVGGGYAAIGGLLLVFAGAQPRQELLIAQ